jgi:hypothetical protein
VKPPSLWRADRVLLLKEKVAGLRIAAALGIAGGAILLRLA